MKSVTVFVFATLLGLSAFAQDTKPAPTATPAPTKVAAAAKVTYKDAKKACLKKDAKLKGKDLQTCIKEEQNKVN